LGNRLYALRKIIAGRHPSDKGTVVQAVLRPWPHSNKQQREALALPDHYLRQPPSSVSVRPSAPTASAGPPALAAPPGAHGEGDPPKEAPAQGSLPLEEEWDLEALSAWFGDS
jgi:hypothetical protein